LTVGGNKETLKIVPCGRPRGREVEMERHKQRRALKLTKQTIKNLTKATAAAGNAKTVTQQMNADQGCTCLT
jgi:hypothetical protein